MIHVYMCQRARCQAQWKRPPQPRRLNTHFLENISQERLLILQAMFGEE
jgi:hypothetical protein